MTDPPPVQQHGAAVTIQTALMLAAAYRAVLHGIARRRADGLPSGDLQHLARALRRAHIAATSPPRHNNAVHPTGATQSNGQDADWIGAGEAAALLRVSRRQVQRLAADPRGGIGGVRIGRTWTLRRSAVLVLAERRQNNKPPIGLP